VDLSCGEAVLRGSDIYHIGVVGATWNVKKGSKVAVYLDFFRVITKGTRDVKLDYSIFLGNGISYFDCEDFFTTKSNGIGVKMIETEYVMPALNGLLPDLLCAQNLPSLIVTHLLDPQPGERGTR
tara:strand:- start:536 stop:910 length:375 start_codon:yes stop_codon:yes gene_type:complete